MINLIERVDCAWIPVNAGLLALLFGARSSTHSDHDRDRDDLEFRGEVALNNCIKQQIKVSGCPYTNLVTRSKPNNHAATTTIDRRWWCPTEKSVHLRVFRADLLASSPWIRHSWLSENAVKMGAVMGGE